MVFESGLNSTADAGAFLVLFGGWNRIGRPFFATLAYDSGCLIANGMSDFAFSLDLVAVDCSKSGRQAIT